MPRWGMEMMTEPMTRLARYQDDLARLLAALEPVERAEVLDGVREHIDAALLEVDHAPTDPDVDRILSDLGSPGAVAEAALAGRAGSDSPPRLRDEPVGGSWREQLMRPWIPPTVSIGIFLLGVFSLSPLAWGPLVVLLVLLVLSPLWTVLEKVIGAVIPPIGLSLATVGAITGRDRVLIPGMILLPIAIAVLVAIAYRGGKRAKRLTHKPVASSG